MHCSVVYLSVQDDRLKKLVNGFTHCVIHRLHLAQCLQDLHPVALLHLLEGYFQLSKTLKLDLCISC